MPDGIFVEELASLCLGDLAIGADFQKFKGKGCWCTVRRSDFQFRSRHRIQRLDGRRRRYGEANHVNVVGGVEVVAVGLGNDVIVLLAVVRKGHLDSPQLERFHGAGFHNFYEGLTGGMCLGIRRIEVNPNTDVGGGFFAQVADDQRHGDVLSRFGRGRQESAVFTGRAEKADIRAGMVDLGVSWPRKASAAS